MTPVWCAMRDESETHTSKWIHMNDRDATFTLYSFCPTVKSGIIINKHEKKTENYWGTRWSFCWENNPCTCRQTFHFVGSVLTSVSSGSSAQYENGCCVSVHVVMTHDYKRYLNAFQLKMKTSYHAHKRWKMRWIYAIRVFSNNERVKWTIPFPYSNHYCFYLRASKCWCLLRLPVYLI